MKGINPDKVGSQDQDVMCVLYPLYERRRMDMLAAAVNKGMFGGK
jgi:hypothetical protein